MSAAQGRFIADIPNSVTIGTDTMTNITGFRLSMPGELSDQRVDDLKETFAGGHIGNGPIMTTIEYQVGQDATMTNQSEPLTDFAPGTLLGAALAYVFGGYGVSTNQDVTLTFASGYTYVESHDTAPGQNGRMGGTITFKHYSSDGSTSPVAVAWS